MKIDGTFQGMDPVQSGVSNAGNPWQKTYFEIITNEGERSRMMAFCAFGNVVEQVKVLQKGAHVEVRFTAESHPYNDKNHQKRYGTDLNCLGLSVITRQSVQPQYQAQYQQGQPVQPQYLPGQPAQLQQTPPPTAYPPAPPTQETAAPAQPGPTTAQPSGAYSYPSAQQPAGSADELPPKNLGFQY